MQDENKETKNADVPAATSKPRRRVKAKMDLEDASAGEMSEKTKAGETPEEKPPVKRPRRTTRKKSVPEEAPPVAEEAPETVQPGRTCNPRHLNALRGDVERGAKLSRLTSRKARKPPSLQESLLLPQENPRSPPNLEPPVEPERKSPPRAIPQRQRPGRPLPNRLQLSRSPLSKK
jgi:hypothetical protein